MHKFLSVVFCSCFLLPATYCQLFTASFSGTGACPTQGNVSVALSNGSVTEFTRTGLNCQTASNAFNSSGFTTDTAVNLGQYIEMTVTANTGYALTITAVNFSMQKSSTGPATVRIAHNYGGGFSTVNDFAPSTTLSGVYWPSFNSITTPAGGSVTFRIYGWGAGSSNGTLRFTNFEVSGTITAASGGNAGGQTPFIFNTANTMAGIGKTPTQALDILGNVRASGKLLVGAVTDTDISGSLTAGNYAVAVNGYMLATKVVVKDYVNWPDYVFEENYPLMPLERLRNYILQQKHLPDVPSAATVSRDGVDVGAGQAVLLRKIEELTLYIIDQQKQLEELKARIAATELSIKPNQHDQ